MANKLSKEDKLKFDVNRMLLEIIHDFDLKTQEEINKIGIDILNHIDNAGNISEYDKEVIKVACNQLTTEPMGGVSEFILLNKLGLIKKTGSKCSSIKEILGMTKPEEMNL